MKWFLGASAYKIVLQSADTNQENITEDTQLQFDNLAANYEYNITIYSFDITDEINLRGSDVISARTGFLKIFKQTWYYWNVSIWTKV